MPSPPPPCTHPILVGTELQGGAPWQTEMQTRQTEMQTRRAEMQTLRTETQTQRQILIHGLICSASARCAARVCPRSP